MTRRSLGNTSGGYLPHVFFADLAMLYGLNMCMKNMKILINFNYLYIMKGKLLKTVPKFDNLQEQRITVYPRFYKIRRRLSQHLEWVFK
jgi:hypothetical protein